MDTRDWRASWKQRDTRFHQCSINELLRRFWAELALPPGSTIFVPLCGKSLDMRWLADCGHRVLGVETSPIAVKAFFRENGLVPTRHAHGRFTRWRAGSIEILCGDYFDLTAPDLCGVAVSYDRASLTALPAALRVRYAAKLALILPATARIFLLTTEDRRDEGWQRTEPELLALFGDDYQVRLVHGQPGDDAHTRPEGSPAGDVDDKLYVLSRHAA